MSLAFTINLFSNVAAPDPTRNMASHALASALAALDPAGSAQITARLFVDPNPNPAALDAWVHAATAASPLPLDVHTTTGLANGYARSLDLCETSHALQLEHDFVLLPQAIPHPLAEILPAMAAARIVHLRFNKRWNRAIGYDAFMTPQEVPGLPCCRVSGWSNNPHIVDVGQARRAVLPLIDRSAPGPHGLEGVIDDYVGGGHVYGPLGHPRTCGHLDGRAVHKRDAAFRRRYLARAGAASR